MLIEKNLKTMTQFEGKEHTYIYRLIKEDFKNEYAYGIEVERQDMKGDQLVSIERDSILKITNQKNKVEDLLQMLYEHQVSPIHLVDIIGDYADKYVADFN